MVKILIIQGTFYEQELQKTTQDVYRIEKVVKSKGNKVLVKWKGYPDQFNSWADKNELCLEAWHINSAHAPLNRDDGGLLS